MKGPLDSVSVVAPCRVGDRPWHWVRWVLAVGFALAGVTVAVRAAPVNLDTEWIRSVELGYERPAEGVSRLEAWAKAHPERAQDGQRLQLARGLLAAQDGRIDDTEVILAPLRQSSGARDARPQAHAHLIQAERYLQQGQHAKVVDEALAASRIYDRLCEIDDLCEPYGLWRSQYLQWVSHAIQGDLAAALDDVRNALSQQEPPAAASLAGTGELSRGPRFALGLRWRALTRAAWAEIALRAGEGSRSALEAIEIAQTEAAQSRDGTTRLEVQFAKARVLNLAGQERAGRAMLEAIRDEARGNSPRMFVAAIANLSDQDLTSGRFRQALDSTTAALAMTREGRDQHMRRVLRHNQAVARLRLGEVEAVRADLPALREMWAVGGGKGHEAMSLRELADAFAAAGDPRTALDLFKREQVLFQELIEINRNTQLKGLRERQDAQRQMSERTRLENELRLSEAEVRSNRVAQQVWALAAVALALVTITFGLLLSRFNAMRKSLQAKQALLRSSSERDALTGLSNRRHFHDVMKATGEDRSFQGALLLVDVDHFKRINDTQGHAAGDTVLVELARRLAGCVRTGDMVVRWGGEEFLLHVPGVWGEALDQFAARVLRIVADRPVQLEGDQSLAITVSMGYAAFPLPPHGLRVDWSHAVNLVDLLLYRAKGQGRHRAVGISAMDVQGEEGLRETEADLERAVTEGRVQLRTVMGQVP